MSDRYDGHPAPPRNDTLIDRLTLWVLRSFAAGMLFFGVSLLMAGVPVVGMLAGSELAMAIAGIFLQIAIVFIAAGAAGMYLSRSRKPLLPNEHPSTSEGARLTNPVRKCSPEAMNFQAMTMTARNSSGRAETVSS